MFLVRTSQKATKGSCWLGFINTIHVLSSHYLLVFTYMFSGLVRNKSSETDLLPLPIKTVISLQANIHPMFIPGKEKIHLGYTWVVSWCIWWSLRRMEGDRPYKTAETFSIFLSSFQSIQNHKGYSNQWPRPGHLSNNPALQCDLEIVCKQLGINERIRAEIRSSPYWGTKLDQLLAGGFAKSHHVWQNTRFNPLLKPDSASYHEKRFIFHSF